MEAVMNMEVAISHHSLLDNSMSTKKEDRHPKIFHEQFNHHNRETLRKGLSGVFCFKHSKNYQTQIRQWSKWFSILYLTMISTRCYLEALGVDYTPRFSS